jgi:hypothetical protein
MKRRLGAFAALLFAAALTLARAEDIKTVTGEEYKNVKISRAEPDGLVIIASYGIIKIPFTELSPELQQKYHYDPQAGAKYRQQLDADQRAREQTIAATQQKRSQELAAAEEKAKALAVVIQTPAPEHSISPRAAGHRGTMLDQPASSGRSSGTMLDRPASKHWLIIGHVVSKNEDGIIVYIEDSNIVGLARPEAGTVVFVAGDYPKLADEDHVNLTCVETGDTYRYTAVSGAAKTVRAYRETR